MKIVAAYARLLLNVRVFPCYAVADGGEDLYGYVRPSKIESAPSSVRWCVQPAGTKPSTTRPIQKDNKSVFVFQPSRYDALDSNPDASPTTETLDGPDSAELVLSASSEAAMPRSSRRSLTIATDAPINAALQDSPGMVARELDRSVSGTRTPRAGRSPTAAAAASNNQSGRSPTAARSPTSPARALPTLALEGIISPRAPKAAPAPSEADAEQERQRRIIRERVRML